ncbi:MAG: hypothetical protein DME25_00830 [Verrucomicrobia bacterium]|nr:MAG: hypothetical protein DME25_00830 [Verrucomicrobiota bacterium]
MIVLSNSVGDFTNIQPAGVYNPYDTNTWSPLVKIVSGINATRNTFTNHVFRRLGDILATPELTVPGYSPYLTTDLTLLTDAVVERIPQQVLSLLKGGEQPRFVIYSYGQALKPANHSLYLGSGPFFQLCTNYQITAEVATRAVIRIEGAPGQPHAVVESFNALPPD